MPTINEVWEQALQINANLGTLHNDQGDIKQRLDEANDWLAEIRTLLADGLTALADGLSGVQARQDVTNQILLFQAQQQEAMICILERISLNTCLILNEATRQTDLQRAIRAAGEHLEHMYATANAEAALALARAQEQQARVDACCPPRPAPEPCTYEPCPAPKAVRPEAPAGFRGYRPEPSRVVRVRRAGPDR
jgi:hypothetical protein